MELLKDLIRDLVGIIFPGTLFISILIWLILGISIPLGTSPETGFLDIVGQIAENALVWFFLIVSSYIAGQYLRIKTLSKLEEKATVWRFWQTQETYRMPDDPVRPKWYQRLLFLAFAKSPKNIEELLENKNLIEETEKTFEKYNSLDEEKIIENDATKLKELANKWLNREKSPFYYISKIRRLRGHSQAYNQFFNLLDQQKILQTTTFFNYCKSVIYEYSPSLKEEILRTESLVRLMAGVYYSLHYCLWINLVLLFVQTILLVCQHFNWTPWVKWALSLNIQASWIIIIIALVLSIFSIIIKRETLNRIQNRRMKEVHLTFEGFYLLTHKYDGLKRALKRLKPKDLLKEK